ncbi:MAG: hypothetical protein AAFZ65_00570 [Planctomycetota bacterium]
MLHLLWLLPFGLIYGHWALWPGKVSGRGRSSWTGSATLRCAHLSRFGSSTTGDRWIDGCVGSSVLSFLESGR